MSFMNKDAPRKRIDKFKANNGHYQQLAVGSPVVGRRGFVVSHGPRHQSCHTTPLQSPCTSPIVTNKDMSGFMQRNDPNSNSVNNTTTNNNSSDYGDNISISSNNSNINQQIRSRINSFKITMFSTQKFYKRKYFSLKLIFFSNDLIQGIFKTKATMLVNFI